jgi:hypothetical protein
MECLPNSDPPKNESGSAGTTDEQSLMAPASLSRCFPIANLKVPEDCPRVRTFSTTPRRLASEIPDDFVDAIRHTELFKKLADKPKALKALSDLYELTKEMGAVTAVFPIAVFCSTDVLTAAPFCRRH